MSLVAPVLPTSGSPFAGEVIVESVRWSRPDGAFGVLAVRHGDSAVSVVGPVGRVRDGDRAVVRGRWTQHPRHGLQIQADSVVAIDPQDGDTQARFLKTITGLGAKRVEMLQAVHGDGLFAALDADCTGVLSRLPRITAQEVAAAAQQWKTSRSERELFVLLAPHGLARLVPALIDAHGPDGVKVVRENPYVLVLDHGVGFAIADRVARELDLPETLPERTEAAMFQVLGDGEGEGHTYLTIGEVMERTARLIGRTDITRLWSLCRKRHAACEDERVWRRQTYRHERTAAGRVLLLRDAPSACSVSVPVDPQGDLSAEQWAAVRNAFTCGFSVVVGNPGTGKTALVRQVAAIASHSGTRFALAAPTGRAARRLEQATGYPATTVHRLLGWGQRRDHAGEPVDGPARHAGDPLDCEVLVVDEASMIDQQMCAHLLDAVRDGTRVLFVGDVDQLPSVGPGRVLGDLIDSGVVPVVRLTTIFRQAARSMIVRAAHAINAGRFPELVPDGPDTLQDFFVMAEMDPDRVPCRVGELVRRRLPRHYDLDPLRDIVVLAPTKKGPAGTVALNHHLQRELNPHGEPVSARGDIRVGDKVIWTTNDTELDLANGMTATVEHHDADTGQTAILDEDGRVIVLSPGQVRNLELAYASTTHRAQGTEAPIAIVVLHRLGTHPALLARQLVYTAITRARTAAIVLGDPGALAEAIGRADALARNTALVDRLTRIG